MTSIITNNGIIGGSTSGDVSLSINTSFVQNRVVGKCDPGSSIREIDINGNVICEIDDDNYVTGNVVSEVSVSNGLELSNVGNATHVNIIADTTYLQRRVSGTCEDGEAIQSIYADGTVLCESMPVYTLNTTEIRMQQTLKSSCPFGSSIQSISASGVVACHTDMDSGGDITALTTGSGITGGGTNGDMLISVDYTTVQKRTSSMKCSDGSAVQTLYENGTLGCTDVYDGDITTVTASDGLLGGGTNGDISLSVDFSTVQKRGTSMECASGSYVQSIFANGTVECVPDENSGGDITSITVSTGLTGSATSGDASLGIDYNTVQQRVGSSCTA